WLVALDCPERTPSTCYGNTFSWRSRPANEGELSFAPGTFRPARPGGKLRWGAWGMEDRMTKKELAVLLSISGCSGGGDQPPIRSHQLASGALPDNCRDPRSVKLIPLYETREWLAQDPGSDSTTYLGYFIFDYTGTPLDPTVRKWDDLLSNTGAKASELLWPEPTASYAVTMLRPQMVDGVPSLAAEPQYPGKFFETKRGLAWQLDDIPGDPPRRPSVALRTAQIRREIAFVQTHMWCDPEDPQRDADGNPIPNTCTDKPFEVRQLFVFGDHEPV